MNWTAVSGFGFGLVFMYMGIKMIIKDLHFIGINSRTLQETGFGGYLLLVIGAISIVVGYYALSPYSWLRQLFKKKKKK
jgi:hypothetical protein